MPQDRSPRGPRSPPRPHYARRSRAASGNCCLTTASTPQWETLADELRATPPPSCRARGALTPVDQSNLAAPVECWAATRGRPPVSPGFPLEGAADEVRVEVIDWSAMREQLEFAPCP